MIKNTLHLKIVTPERIVLETEVNSVNLPTPLGQITVLPGHVPLTASMIAGEIHFLKGMEEEFFSVSSGFIEIKKDNQVIILADTAEFGHEIDLERAQAAAQAARDEVKKAATGIKPIADLSAVLQKNLARIKVAHKHRTKKK